jgi:hypothetical protein
LNCVVLLKIMVPVLQRNATQYARDKWRKTRSVPWLVASLAKAHAGDQNAEELIKAAPRLLRVRLAVRPYVNASSERDTLLEKIDSYRDNWWCSDVGAAIEVPNYQKDSWYGHSSDNTKPYDPNPGLPFPAFLTPEQKQAAGEQWERLSQIGTAPNYLTSAVLTYAKAHPDDPRVPEALHLAVRSTRYGCDNKKTTRLSREAYTWLHQRYPKSEWAKKTKFWF